VRLHTLLALGHLVGDLVTLIEGLESLSYYACVVHKEVLTSVVWDNKAVAFLGVEPLDCSFWGHVLNLALAFSITRRAKLALFEDEGNGHVDLVSTNLAVL
jgi:hypothetical protein